MKQKSSFLSALVVSIAAIGFLAGLPRIANATQVDTNATTVVTNYVPGRLADVLIGKTGSTTTVWLATGQTTGSWTQISRAP